MEKILSYPGVLLRRLTKTHFIGIVVSNAYITTLTLVAVVVFWSFPSYDVAFVTHEMDANWNAIFLQADEPFTDHTALYSSGSHAGKLAFRFVPALLLNVLHIHSKASAFVFQFFTMVLFYFLLVTLFNSLFRDRVKALLYALPICFVISGHVYFTDYRGFFDTLALDFLLLAFLWRKKAYVIIPLLLAYFTDERALVAAPGLFLVGLLEQDSFGNISQVLRGMRLPTSIYLFISWLAYVVIRLFLARVVGLRTVTGATNLFMDQIKMTLYTLYIGLEAFIIPFIMVILALCRKKINAYPVLIILCFLALVFVSQSVFDINRSMSYVLLIIILTLLLLDKLYDQKTVFKIIAWVIVINFLYDGSYPLIVQLLRMKFKTHSI